MGDDGLAESDEAMDEAVVNHKVNKQSTTTASTSLAYTTAEGRGGEERENGEEGEEIQLLMMGREAMARGKGTTRREKPLLRGVSHQVACFVALVSGIVLMFKAPNEKAMVSAGVFALSLTTLFGISALYHRPTWKPDARRIMRRLDHSAIFVLIAGTYTPMILLTFTEDYALILGLIWLGAAIGVGVSVFWTSAPKSLIAALCVSFGWAGVWNWKSFQDGLLGHQIAAIAAGGISYSVGAIVYATKVPDPWPRVFGYHEIFHALTVLAAGCHYFVVWELVCNSQ